MEIELSPGASPIRILPHNLSAKDEQVLEEEVQEMLDKGTVERAKTSKWVFPFFIARGKSHSSRTQVSERSAVNFRRLNFWLKVIEYPFVVGEQMIDKILHGTSFVVTHLDMNKAYNQELVVEKQGCLTIIAPRSRLVRFKVLTTFGNKFYSGSVPKTDGTAAWRRFVCGWCES
jgi:hypothetical protein